MTKPSEVSVLARPFGICLCVCLYGDNSQTPNRAKRGTFGRLLRQRNNRTATRQTQWPGALSSLNYSTCESDIDLLSGGPSVNFGTTGAARRTLLTRVYFIYRRELLFNVASPGTSHQILSKITLFVRINNTYIFYHRSLKNNPTWAQWACFLQDKFS